MIEQTQFNKALDSIGNCKAELAETYRLISEMSQPLNSNEASELAEASELFKASVAVQAAQRNLAAVCDKLLTAVTVPAAAKV